MTMHYKARLLWGGQCDDDALQSSSLPPFSYIPTQTLQTYARHRLFEQQKNTKSCFPFDEKKCGCFSFIRRLRSPSPLPFLPPPSLSPLHLSPPFSFLLEVLSSPCSSFPNLLQLRSLSVPRFCSISRNSTLFFLLFHRKTFISKLRSEREGRQKEGGVRMPTTLPSLLRSPEKRKTDWLPFR